MIKRTSTDIQIGFSNLYIDQLNLKYPLCILSHQINWKEFDSSFSKHYSQKMGKPSKPIGLIY